MRRRFLLLLLFLFPVLLRAQVINDPQQAFEQATAAGKPILLVFQGSDWCLPCIRMEQKVLSATDFMAFAKDKLIILKADFPQKKKIPPVLEQQYEALAEAFNAEGSFPKMVLLSKDRKLLHTFGKEYLSAEALMAELNQVLKESHAAM